MSKLVVLPFSGFYNSVHDAELDEALNQAFGDSSGSPIDELVRRAFDEVQWRKAHLEYAKAYASCFAEEFGIDGLKFESMQSPREYNFTTDRIFAEIPMESLEKIRAETPDEVLTSVAAEHFTSRSGFCSFYRPDWQAWGALEEWDHNQLFALLDAYARHNSSDGEFGSWKEYDIMERWRGNGGGDECIFTDATEELNRLAKIAWYLREREDRKYRLPRTEEKA